MADPTAATPDEMRAVIEEHLASLKQAAFTEGYCYSRTFDEEHLKTIDRQRRSIEALEYALSHAPDRASPYDAPTAAFGTYGRVSG